MSQLMRVPTDGEHENRIWCGCMSELVIRDRDNRITVVWENQGYMYLLARVSRMML